MESARPEISVIICNYNYADFVGSAVASVLAQCYKNVQLIVVDDGSTDGSVDLLRSLNLKNLVLKSNGGQSSGIRCGLELVTGKILIILDSDDYLHPEACEEVSRCWRDQTVLVQFRLEKKDFSGRTVGFYPDQPFVESHHKEFVLKYGYLPSSPTSGNAFLTEHVRKCFMMNRDRDWAYVDGYLIFTSPFYGEVLHIDRPLGVYRVHGRNVSLSSGITRARLLNRFRTNLSHRVGLADHLSLLGVSKKSSFDLLDPANWRAAFSLKVIGTDIPELRSISIIDIAFITLKSYLRYPQLKFASRLKNVLFVVTALILRKRFVVRFLPAE